MPKKNKNGIFSLHGTDNPERELDVIFVHGLGGDAYSTWESSEDNDVFWPDWLGEDFKNIGIWTIGYGATPSRWVEDVMAMEDRALNLLNNLSVKDIGNKPILFITHSMGGLITKHILDQAKTHSQLEYKTIADNTRGVVFLAVPHNGAGWASLLDAARLLVRGNKIIEQLEKDDPGLRRLSNSFTQFVKSNSLKCWSFFETEKTPIKKKLFNWIEIRTKGVQVVSESSARGDFPQETPIGLDDNHLSICKLDSKDGDQLYGNIVKIIGKYLLDSPVPETDSSEVVSPKIQISKLPQTNSELFGREDELAMLDLAWDNPHSQIKSNILTIKAMGGIGKTALMKTWVDKLALDDFHGANAVYTWSFYSQGSAEDKQVSADEFFDAALRWFGYQGEPIASAHDKGLKLAELINQQRSLILLDGLEPLQYPAGGAMDGALRDQGLKTLFLQLAAQNKGLLVISSRQDITELASQTKPLVILHELEPLSISAGIALFRAANITGTDQELEDTTTEYNGHALSLNLLAKYLREYEDCDIRQRTNLKTLTDFPEETRDTRHAYKVMAAYEKQLHNTPELQILYMLGLFDRPVSAGAIRCLRDAAIGHIANIPPDERLYKALIKRLRNQDLLNKQNPEYPDTLDTHPLIREYFGKRLQKRYQEAWQQAHQQLYEYYKAQPKKERPDTLAEMEPLFAAIAHGCAAGMHSIALEEVYYPRIQRDGNINYLCSKLGAFGADLSAVSHFFAQHWHTPAAGLTDNDKASALNWAAIRLRALGRLQEAEQPMQACLEIDIELENWTNAAITACNMSEMQQSLGDVSLAIKVAKQSVELADKCSDENWRMISRTSLAHALHQSGDMVIADVNFEEAETLHKKRQVTYPLLYSLSGFHYCDLLLTAGKWLEVQQRAKNALELSIKYLGKGFSLSDIGLDKLSLGRACLQQAISLAIVDLENTQESVGWISAAPSTNYPLDTRLLPKLTSSTKVDDTSLSALRSSENWLNQAVEALRRAGTEDHLPLGLLARASFQRYAISFNTDISHMELMESGESHAIDDNSLHSTKMHAVYKAALQNLQEVHDIAQRSCLRLHLTDYHLESARLLFTRLIVKADSYSLKELSFTEPELIAQAIEHMDQASELIEETGYKRRTPELLYLQDCVAQIFE